MLSRITQSVTVSDAMAQRKYMTTSESSAMERLFQSCGKNIKRALEAFYRVMVNSVYGADTYRYLPKTIEYFSKLGVRQIYLNPNNSAKWTIVETSQLDQIYKQIGDKYIRFYLENDPFQCI